MDGISSAEIRYVFGQAHGEGTAGTLSRQSACRIRVKVPYSVTLQSVEINENDSVQENGQNKSASKTVQTYPPISDICQGTLNVSVGIEERGY